jgi:hypothetical protein
MGTLVQVARKGVVLVTVITILTACDGPNMAEVQNLFESKCNQGDATALRSCLADVKVEINSFKELKSEELKIEMLTRACMDDPIGRLSDRLDETTDAFNSSRAQRSPGELCRMRAIKILGGS